MTRTFRSKFWKMKTCNCNKGIVIADGVVSNFLKKKVWPSLMMFYYA